ncbi:MAG: HepT-like ribonuclease domain-containing protein [Candidatus Freyarchaeota archaeon]
MLSHSESLTAKKVIGFRNIIVHAYLDLNTNIVLNITQGEKNTATY